ncbi:MAG TPA: hypothetical protein VHP33_35985 [Polyangiaceae bacterium]|nr:hypothetical protein [Polyangiaceae bacterium]
MTRGFGVFGCVCAIALSVPGHARAQVAPRPLTPPPASGRFEVALNARSTHASARAEQAAWLSVTLPLDKLALPRVAQRPSVPEPRGAVPASASSSPPPAPTPTPSPSAGPTPAPTPPLVTFQQLHALSDLSRRATRVALAVVSAAAERRRLDALSSRARASALLPELRLRAVRNTDQALRWAPTGDDPYRVTQAEGAGIILEASAIFRLDRLLFAHEELAVERARQDASEQRSKLEARVQAAVLGLFRARELACAEPRDDSKPTLELLKALEQFQELDSLTAGWFADEAPRFGVAVWGFSEAVLGVCSPPAPPSARPATNPVASLENSE